MSKMKMPGFTAEASLCKMDESYYMNGTNATLINGREVRPQLCYHNWRSGKLCCYVYGEWVCHFAPP
jgi:hypothetical protein